MIKNVENINVIVIGKLTKMKDFKNWNGCDPISVFPIYYNLELLI